MHDNDQRDDGENLFCRVFATRQALRVANRFFVYIDAQPQLHVRTKHMECVRMRVYCNTIQHSYLNDGMNDGVPWQTFLSLVQFFELSLCEPFNQNVQTRLFYVRAQHENHGFALDMSTVDRSSSTMCPCDYVY